MKFLSMGAIVTVSLLLMSCDAGIDSQPADGLVFELPEVRRSIRNVAPADLKLDYTLTVFDSTGAEVSSETLSVPSTAGPLTPDVEVGYRVFYDFEWIHRDFNVPLARASRTVDVVTVGQVERPNYSWELDDDGDDSNNVVELDEGFSPVSAQDLPGNPITPIDARREFLNERLNSSGWTRPVFGCRNPPEVGTASWYWIFDENGMMYGLEESPVRITATDRGSYLPSNRPVITGDDGLQFVWDFDTNSQSMKVFGEPRVWGECVRLAGPRLDRNFNVVSD